MDSDDPTPPLEPAAAALARARAAEQAARDRGSPYGIAVARTQAGHALVGLGRPEEALVELDEAARYVELMRAEGSHDLQRLLRMTSASAPPPDADTGDLGLLQAWVLVGRAGALAAAGRGAEAAAAVEAARPHTRGWRRRDLRRALDQVAAGVAAPGPAEGSGSPPDLAGRYEQAAALVEAGRVAEGARAALLVVRDADAAGDARLLAAARQVLGAALAAGGMGPEAAGEQATAALQQAFDGFAALGDDTAVAAAAPGLAGRLDDEGDPARAVEVLERGHAAALRTGDAAVQIDLLIALTAARDAAGDTAGALSAADQAVAQATDLGDEVRAADARHGEAVVRAVHLSTDPEELVESLSLLDQARDAYARTGHPDRAAGCDHEAAALLARAGALEAAAARYDAARTAYLALPVGRRDAGAWPDEVADCVRNRELIDALRRDPTTATPPGAFLSGGHRMRRGGPG